jgi:hypothetical protein
VHGGATLVWNAEFEGYGFAVLGVPVHPEDMGAAALGLTSDEGRVLFNQAWAPASGLTVPDALRRLADGASLLGVSSDRVRTACSMYPDHRMVEEYHAELAAHA